MMDWTGNVGTLGLGSLASNCNVSLKLWRRRAHKKTGPKWVLCNGDASQHFNEMHVSIFLYRI